MEALGKGKGIGIRIGKGGSMGVDKKKCWLKNITFTIITLTNPHITLFSLNLIQFSHVSITPLNVNHQLNHTISASFMRHKVSLKPHYGICESFTSGHESTS